MNKDTIVIYTYCVPRAQSNRKKIMMMMEKQSKKLRKKQLKKNQELQMKKKAEEHLKTILLSANKNNNLTNVDSFQNESIAVWSTQHIIKIMIQCGMF